jgi:hypothetical protein
VSAEKGQVLTVLATLLAIASMRLHAMTRASGVRLDARFVNTSRTCRVHRVACMAPIGSMRVSGCNPGIGVVGKPFTMMTTK